MTVIVVSGPTASGKTDLGLKLARSLGGEVVNFDSLLLYQEINIGTAKPSPEERREIPHHLIDVRSIRNPMNAADYSRVARPLVEELLSQKKIVYLVGGSGFYLQALLKGMYNSPTTPEEILQRSEELYRSSGIAPFEEILKDSDPESAERYHANDHYRIRRAVEHFWTTGRKFSQERAQKDEANAAADSSTVHDWEIIHLHLDLPKEEHQEIIRSRTKKMLETGLVDEVKDLLAQGFTGQEKPLQSIGYKETLEYLKGGIPDLAALEERITVSTRQLAKSQRTWFNRVSGKTVFHPLAEAGEVFDYVREALAKKKGPS